jgi:hypothetical protein
MVWGPIARIRIKRGDRLWKICGKHDLTPNLTRAKIIIAP